MLIRAHPTKVYLDPFVQIRWGTVEGEEVLLISSQDPQYRTEWVLRNDGVEVLVEWLRTWQKAVTPDDLSAWPKGELAS